MVFFLTKGRRRAARFRQEAYRFLTALVPNIGYLYKGGWRMRPAREINRMVVKCGTGVMTGRFGKLDRVMFGDIARQCAEARVSCVIVSSGAVKSGKEVIDGDNGKIGGHLTHKEYAGVGARYLLQRWGDAFMHHGREIAQIWITPMNLMDEGERDRIGQAIHRYLWHGFIPIINENDVVSESWRGMDNDLLAATIAKIIRPDAILFLTAVGGVYEKDPRQDPRARRYDSIDTGTAYEIASLMTGVSPHGKGGMGEKIVQAASCAEMGMVTAIASPAGNSIIRFARGESVGTMIYHTTHSNKENHHDHY